MKCEFGINKEVVQKIIDGEKAKKKFFSSVGEEMDEVRLKEKQRLLRCSSEGEKLQEWAGLGLMMQVAEKLTKATKLKLTLIAEEM